MLASRDPDAVLDERAFARLAYRVPAGNSDVYGLSRQGDGQAGTGRARSVRHPASTRALACRAPDPADALSYRSTTFESPDRHDTRIINPSS